MHRKLASIVVGLIATAAFLLPSVAHAAAAAPVGEGCSTIQVAQTHLYLRANGIGHTSTVTAASSGTVFCEYAVTPGSDFIQIRDQSGNCLSLNTAQYFDGYITVSVEAASTCANTKLNYPWLWWTVSIYNGNFTFENQYDYTINGAGCMYVNTEAITTSCNIRTTDKYEQFIWPYVLQP
jgi:hypothetical protein